ncbi:MAG: GYD domain-containing protein [Gammaproteobacteria bacterium]
MSTYLCLSQWTQKGIENIKESPARLDAAREEWEKQGVTIRDFYLTTGQYDLVFVVEAADDATLAKVLLAQASKGGIRTTTLHAFSEAEYREIIGSL